MSERNGIFSGLAISFWAFFLALGYAVLGSGCVPVEDLDNGYLSCPEDPSAIPYPSGLPAGIVADDTVSPSWVDTSEARWEDWLGADVFSQGLGDTAYEVFVRVAQVEPYAEDDDEAYGQARVSWAPGCRIIHCEITLNVDFSYDDATMTQALTHELGHCLGLADDPGIDVTVDLRSIMGSPMDPLGELTEHDRGLLVESLGLL